MPTKLLLVVVFLALFIADRLVKMMMRLMMITMITRRPITLMALAMITMITRIIK